MTLLIDLDRKWTACRFHRWAERAEAVLRIMEYRPVNVHVEETRRGLHVAVETDPAPTSKLEAIALQAAMGSDSHRTAYDLRRIKAGREDAANYFFKAKYRDGTVWEARHRPDWDALLKRYWKDILCDD